MNEIFKTGFYTIAINAAAFFVYKSIQRHKEEVDTSAPSSVVQNDGMGDKKLLNKWFNSRSQDGSVYFPNHLTYAYLSSHCYREAEERTKDDGSLLFACDEIDLQRQTRRSKLMEHWRIWKTVDDQSGYHAVIYENKQNKWLVIAHRGTQLDLRLKKILLENYDLTTDLDSIFMNRPTNYIEAAKYATFEALDYAKKQGYSFSMTGHSLGGWLAQLSLFFCVLDNRTLLAKAVTFDSPGALNMVQLMTDRKRQLQSVTSSMDVTSYLCEPNLVNTCNTHLETVLLYIEAANSSVGKKRCWKPVLLKLAETAKETHGIDFILGQLQSPDSNIRRILEWPLMHVKGRNEVKNPSDNSLLKVVCQAVWKLFGVKYQNAMRTELYDPYKEAFCEDDHVSYYLKQLKQLESRQSELPVELEASISFLNTQFAIDCVPPHKGIQSERPYTISDVRDFMRLILHRHGEELRKLLAVHSRAESDGDKASKSPSPQPFNFKVYREQLVGRFDQLEEIRQALLQGDKFVLITGLPGCGKTTLAHEFAYLRMLAGDRVVWFNAENADELHHSFCVFSKTLGVEPEGASMQDLINATNAKLCAGDGETLFVFDNVADMGMDMVRQYYSSTSDRVKVLMTSRDETIQGRDIIGRTLKLKPFTRNEAIEYIQSQRSLDRQTKEDLVALVKCNAAFLLPCLLQLVVKDADADAELVPRTASASGIDRFVVQVNQNKDNVLRKLFEKLDEREKTLLRYLVHLAPDNVPFDLLMKLCEDSGTAAKSLEKRGLVKVSRENDTMQIHRSILEYAKSYVINDACEERVYMKVLTVFDEHLTSCIDKLNRREAETMNFTWFGHLLTALNTQAVGEAEVQLQACVRKKFDQVRRVALYFYRSKII